MSYLPRASRAAKEIPQILANRGLDPALRGFKFFDHPTKGAWLFAVLDEARIEKIERYTNREVVHQISTALGGMPVVVSNTTGLRYGVLVSPKPEIPKDVAFPGARLGLLQVGETITGPASTTIEEFGNCIVAGITRSGKSNFLRLITTQVLASGHQAILVDPQGDAFPPEMQSHPGVLASGMSLDSAPQAIGMATEVYFQRQAEASSARQAGGARPEFKHLFLVIDEFTGLILNHGGAGGRLAKEVFNLAFGALKYHIHIILGGHEFTKDDVGPIAGQMFTRVCFRVGRASIGQVVVGRRDLVEVRTTGRAFSQPWGWIQVYRMEDRDIIQAIGPTPGDGLSAQDRALRDYILEHAGGRLTHEALQAYGYSKSQAANARAEWVRRGLARPEPRENNSIVLVDRGEVGNS